MKAKVEFVVRLSPRTIELSLWHLLRDEKMSDEALREKATKLYDVFAELQGRDAKTS